MALTETEEVVNPMEPTETTEIALSSSQLRHRLKQRGMSVTEFAKQAGMHQSTLSAVLTGRIYAGGLVRERVESTILRLGLDQEIPRDDELSPPEPVFRIRRL